MAAAGLFALQNNIDRLAEDHRHAKQVCDKLLQSSCIKSALPVETNIIIFETADGVKPLDITNKLKQQDIFCLPVSPTQIRMVFHLDISAAQVDQILDAIGKL
jgi:threonine aldolase